jgi:hypothetical protein
MMRIVLSSCKLLLIIGGSIAVIVRAFFQRQRSVATAQTRLLLLAIHDDLLKAVVALQKRLWRWETPIECIDRVLIIKLDRIGDMVNTTPAFDALQHYLPHARLDLVGHPATLALLEGDSRIAERIPYWRAIEQ